MKLSILPLISIIFLIGCSDISTNSTINSIDSIDQTTSTIEQTSTETSDSSSSLYEPEQIFYKEFSNYKDNELQFFQEGYSTVNSKFGDNYLNLIDKDGFIRTCDIDNLDNGLTINIKSHVTNLNNLNSSAIGQTFSFKVETINYYENDQGMMEYDSIDAYEFSYTLNENDIENKTILGIPDYSSDFSKQPITFNLDGKNANKILITMTSKIEFTMNEKNAGCNFSINSLEVLK